MEHRKMGGVSVSRLGLGTMTWGRDTDENEAAQQLQYFIEAGGNLIDTAAVYGDGDAERVLGGFIGTLVKRDQVFIASKAGITFKDGARKVNNSRNDLKSDLDRSLTRLNVDFLDLWQIHTWDKNTPLDETLSEEVIPASSALNLGFLAWSPLGRGVLTGKYRGGVPSDSRGASPHFANFVEPYLSERARQVVEAVCVAADGLGYSPLEVALSWVRDAPGVTSALIGARTGAQLRGILTVEQITLPDQVRQALNEVSAN